MARTKKQLKRDGSVVRLSSDVLDLFPTDPRESIDNAFRRRLGLEGKEGQDPETVFWLITRPTLKLYRTKAEALGGSIVAMVRTKHKHKEKVRRVVILK